MKLSVPVTVLVMSVVVLGVRAITVTRELERIKIDPPEPSRMTVRSGSNVTLSCSASHPWFLCLWVHPTGDKLCSIKEDGTDVSVCQGLEGARLVSGDNHCHVHLENVGEEDSGDWLCLLSQEGVYHTDRAVTSLSVATPSLPSLQPPGPLYHGEEVNINCGATSGHPRPEFSWALLDSDGEGSRDLESGVTWRDLNSSLTFTPARSDSGLRLVCSTRQLDLSTNTVLYSHHSSTTLTVRVRPSPIQAYLEEQQDVVAGVVISCFLILFCVGLVIVFTVRSTKKTRGSAQASEVTPGQDSYIIFISEDPANTDTRSDKESGIDVSHGDFVSFSSSDLYTNTTANTANRSSSLTSQKTQSEPDQDQSIDESGGSEGGLSNTSSVFDCQHGCFGHEHGHHGHHGHHQHQHQHQHKLNCHYLRANVLNTDL